jgi:hypothetical protein
MSKKVLIIELVAFVSIATLLIIFGASKNQGTEAKNNDDGIKTEVAKADKVQVFTFHATQRCTTCIAIGKLSGETVEEYYQAELKSGKIEVREINIDLPENKELAKKFQASGSALKINAIYDGQDHITEDTAVWRLTSNPEQFKSYLKNKIDNLLGK